MLDTRLYTLLAELPPSSLIFALVLAVVLAPVVYRSRLRFNRWLRRLAWFSAGLALGIILSS
jgi:hypothetical protein